MVHKFRLHGTNIVVDVNSGSVHIFDEVSFEVLNYYKEDNNTTDNIVNKLSDKYSEDDIRESINEIKHLEDVGQLYSEDNYKNNLPNYNSKPIVKALCLHISHDCNLRCKYCFANEGSFGGKRSMMSFDVGKKAIDFLIKESGNRKNLEIDFFGGEPLLNFDTVKRIVEYAKEQANIFNKKFKFTLTTNSILLNDDIKDYLNNNMQNVVLSIDGREKTNDNMRKRIDGSGTYKDILPKIMDMANSRNQENYYVRGTFTAENFDFSEDVIHLADLGFKQISVEPAVDAKGTSYEIKEEHIPIIFKEYENLAKMYLDRNLNGQKFNFFHFMIDLTQGPCIIKRLNGCGSGHEYLAITPEGDIYPCHQFVGIEEFNMGNVSDGVLNKDIQEKFKKTDIYTKDNCPNCWAKFYCSGGCLANAYKTNKDLNSTNYIECQLEKKRLECALWVKTQMSKISEEE